MQVWQAVFAHAKCLCPELKYIILSFIINADNHDDQKAIRMAIQRKDLEHFLNPLLLVCPQVKTRVFIAGCSKNNLEIAQKVHRDFPSLSYCAIMDSFCDACENGHERIVEWLIETFNLSNEEEAEIAQDDRCPECIYDGRHQDWPVGAPKKLFSFYDVLWKGFDISCAHGQKEIMQYLVRKFKVRDQDLKFSPYSAFCRACAYGHKGVAEWLNDRFHFTKDDVIQCESFTFACENGHKHVAEWLASEFSFTLEDIKLNENRILRLASIRGHKHVVEWLCRNFNLQLDCDTMGQLYFNQQ